MTLRTWLRFCGWFAHRDLFEPNALRTTRVNRRSIALVTALSLLAFGAAEGTRDLRLAGFRKNPLALCIWVGSEFEEGRIDATLLDKMKSGLGGALKANFRDVCPFEPVKYGWHQTQGKTASKGGGQDVAPGVLGIWGRTLGKGDPLLDSLKDRFVAGRPFRDDDQEGVIVMTGMLDLLRGADPTPTGGVGGKPKGDSSAGVDPATRPGRPQVTYPEELFIYSVNFKGDRLRVPVVGVVDAALPGGNQLFIINSRYEKTLRLGVAPIRATQIHTGPLPESWLKLKPFDLPKRLGNLLSEKNPEYRVERRTTVESSADPGRKVWELQTALKAGLLVRTWSTLLESMRRTMGEEGFDAPESIVKEMEPWDKTQDRVEDPTAFRMATVYLNDPSALETAANLVKGFGFPTADSDIQTLLAIDRNSQQAMLASSVLALVLLANGCSNMRVIQKLRAELKLTEIGMLKAMGMSDRELRSLHVYEAWTLWWRGTLQGIAWGLIIGFAMDNILTHVWSGGLELGFRCPWLFLVLIPLATGFFFLYNAVAGTREARQASPIETLRTN